MEKEVGNNSGEKRWTSSTEILKKAITELAFCSSEEEFLDITLPLQPIFDDDFLWDNEDPGTIASCIHHIVEADERSCPLPIYGFHLIAKHRAKLHACLQSDRKEVWYPASRLIHTALHTLRNASSLNLKKDSRYLSTKANQLAQLVLQGEMQALPTFISSINYYQKIRTRQKGTLTQLLQNRETTNQTLHDIITYGASATVLQSLEPWMKRTFPFSFDAKQMLEAWIEDLSEHEISRDRYQLLSDHIQTLFALEKEMPGSVRAIQKSFFIHCIGRYHTSELLALLERKTEVPSSPVLIVQDPYDWTNAMKKQKWISKMIQHVHQTRIFEKFPYDLGPIVTQWKTLEYPPPSLIIFDSHARRFLEHAENTEEFLQQIAPHRCTIVFTECSASERVRQIAHVFPRHQIIANNSEGSMSVAIRMNENDMQIRISFVDEYNRPSTICYLPNITDQPGHIRAIPTINLPRE